MALDAVSAARSVRRARTTRPMRTHPSRSRRARLAISHLRPADEPGDNLMAIRCSPRQDAGGLPEFCSGDTIAERVPTIARNVRSSTSPCTSSRPAGARGAGGQGTRHTPARSPTGAPHALCQSGTRCPADSASWPTGANADWRRPAPDKEKPRVPGGVREVSGRPSRHRLLWWNCTRGRGLLTADN